METSINSDNLRVLSENRFKAFDLKYCMQSGQTEYCLTFKQLAFGPGYVGEARWGQSGQEGISLGQVSSRDGQTFYFTQADWIGRFHQGQVELFKEYLKLEGK